jgi:hypothetical protein
MALSIFKSLFGKKADSCQETNPSEPIIQGGRNMQSTFQRGEDNVFVLNAGKASKITLIGASESSAKQSKNYVTITLPITMP